MAALRVRMFDPKGIRSGRILFLIGKRHTGKTVLMLDLLYHMPRPDYVVAMAPTEDTLAVFRKFLPACSIYDHFSQDALDRVVTAQRELLARGQKRTVLVILDDCLYQKNVLRSNAMRHIFFNGRHDNISLLCCAQYAFMLSRSGSALRGRVEKKEAEAPRRRRRGRTRLAADIIIVGVAPNLIRFGG